MYNTYSIEATERFIYEYTVKGGKTYQLSDGVLGVGDMILFDPTERMKTYIIREVALNEWSSGQTIRAHSKMPKKYKKILEEAGMI